MSSLYDIIVYAYKHMNDKKIIFTRRILASPLCQFSRGNNEQQNRNQTISLHRQNHMVPGMPASSLFLFLKLKIYPIKVSFIKDVRIFKCPPLIPSFAIKIELLSFFTQMKHKKLGTEYTSVPELWGSWNSGTQKGCLCGDGIDV